MDDSSIKPPPDTTTSNLRIHAAIALALFAFTVLLFLQVRHFDFINFDDPNYILANPHVRAGLSWHGVGWAFTTFHASNWHPLTWLSHMLDVALFGLNPAGHHLTSVILHGINAALAYLVLVSMTGSKSKSAIVAALFAVHPLRMESVVWISERKDLLCAMFYLLAVGAYGIYARTGLRKWYAATVATFALGAMSKPMIVTLPCALLLMDFWPLRRIGRVSFGKLLVEKIPLFVLALGSGVITFIAQRLTGATESAGHLPLSLRIGNAVWAYGRYVRKTFWPNDLAAFYPYLGHVPGTSLPWDKVALSGVALLTISATAALLWRRDRAVLVGWLWFLGVMIPTIGVVQVGMQSMADRYSYLPHIGLFIAIVWGVGTLTDRWRGIAGLACMIAGVAIAVFAGCTAYQLRYWQNSATLFTHAMQVTNANAFARTSVGMYWSEHHRDDKAEPYYVAALNIDPGSVDAHMNLANLLAARGQTRAALRHAQAAVRLLPISAQAHNNLANLLVQLGRIPEAIGEHQAAIRLDPDLAQAHYNYGVTLAQLGKMREAEDQFVRALQIQPDYPNARYLYGLALMADNQPAAAEEQFTIALQLLADSDHDPALQAQIEARMRMLRRSK